MERRVTWVFGLCGLALALGPSLARAQVPPAPPPEAPAAAPEPATPTAQAQTPPPAAPEAAAPALPLDETAACILGPHEGINPPDARTSAILVCEALRNAGVRVAAQLETDAAAANRGSAYRIELRPLGYIIVLGVHYEAPIGRPVRSRSLQLNSIEEVPVAAPRIAESFVHGTTLTETAKVNTLVGQETRTYGKKYGETLFSIGIFGFALPNDTWAGYGVVGRFYYEAARYAVGLDLRGGGSANSDGGATLVTLSVGARYFLNEADISPFVGGGLGIMWLSVDRSYRIGSGSTSITERLSMDGSGLAGFGEVGVELLRLHKTRFDVLLRADAPFFELHAGGHSTYRLPIALVASYSFN